VDKFLKFNVDIFLTKKVVQGFECWSIHYPKSSIEWLKYITSINHIIKINNQYKNIKAIIAYNYQAIALKRLKNYYTKYNIKIIGDCTEWYSTKGANIIFKIIKGFDSFLRMRVIQRKLDGMIVVSSFLEDYYISHKNIVRIPPLVDINEKKWSISTDERLVDRKIKFVYSGIPGKTKDKINIVIEALYNLKKFKNYIFNIIGITEEQYLNNFYKHKKLLNVLKDRINFIGRIKHEDSLKYLRQADLSILLREDTRSNKAGFPTKFVESISCGVPVLTTNTSDLRYYLKEGENGFFVDINIPGELEIALGKILGGKINSLKNMKNKYINSKNFYYKNYTGKMNNFIKGIFNQVAN
jgi:glycosyltransferase involved in cell wall biosynthesis